MIRFHDLRHSHCTQLLDAEVRVDIVTERLGHSSVAFTLDRYTDTVTRATSGAVSLVCELRNNPAGLEVVTVEEGGSAGPRRH